MLLLIVYLHINELFYQLSLGFNITDFSYIAVCEMIRFKIDSWSASHEVHNYLNQPLLLKGITRVFEAF